MVLIKVTVNDERAQALLDAVEEAMRPANYDPVIEVEAQKAYADLLVATPQGLTGRVRRSWVIERLQPGARRITNTAEDKEGRQIVAHLEYGTANGGTGYIYPKVKKVLFIPLTRVAAEGGWSPELKRGKDYVLAKRVKGIKPLGFIATVREDSKKRLTEAFTEYLKEAIAKAKRSLQGQSKEPKR